MQRAEFPNDRVFCKSIGVNYDFEQLHMCCWFSSQITNGGGLKMSIKGIIYFVIRYLAPLAIAVIFVTGLL